MRLLRLLALAALLIVAASAQSVASCGSPRPLGDGWQIATPEAAGLDGTLFCGIASRLQAMEANIHAVVVVRHGKLIFEQYFDGYDDPWGQPEGLYKFDPVRQHDMRSVSKSVTSLLVGIAIDRKLIASIDEPVLKYFPDYAALRSPGWDAITLRHLLAMQSGIAWDEARAWNDPKNDEPYLGSEPDPIRYVLAKPIAAPPMTIWNYNGGGTDLLGAVLARVTGKPLDDFAREALFEPLGITDWEWKAYGNGKIAAAAGLRMRPRDAAKLGQLLLTDGRWDGRQIVSANWIAQSVTPRAQAIGYFGGLMYYGYQWWMGRSLLEGRDVPWIAAMGLGGQRIIAIPAYDMVVMTTSGLYGSPRQGAGTLEILSRFVLPAVRDKSVP